MRVNVNVTFNVRTVFLFFHIEFRFLYQYTNSFAEFFCLCFLYQLFCHARELQRRRNLAALSRFSDRLSYFGVTLYIIYIIVNIYLLRIIIKPVSFFCRPRCSSPAYRFVVFTILRDKKERELFFLYIFLFFRRVTARSADFFMLL